MFVTTWMSCILKRMYVRALLELCLTFQVKQRMDSILDLIIQKKKKKGLKGGISTKSWVEANLSPPLHVIH